MDQHNLGEINYEEGDEKVELRNGRIYNVKISEESGLQRVVYFTGDFFLLLNDAHLNIKIKPNVIYVEEIEQVISGEETELFIKFYRYLYVYYTSPYGTMYIDGKEIKSENIREYFGPIIETIQPYVLNSEADLEFIKGEVYKVSIRDINIETKEWNKAATHICIYIGFFDDYYSFLNDKTICMFEIQSGRFLFFQMSEILEYSEFDGANLIAENIQGMRQYYLANLELIDIERERRQEEIEREIEREINLAEYNRIPSLVYQKFMLSTEFLLEFLKIFFKYLAYYEECKLYRIRLDEDGKILDYKCLFLGVSHEGIIYIIDLYRKDPEIGKS